ncbi:MAG: PASTA domain-containing protein [Actinomycetota bacterium]|nr:PASTA domain-containing protein [Actinomycetota bacterium]
MAHKPFGTRASGWLVLLPLLFLAICWISCGEAKTVVPDLAGLDPAEAQALLHEAGLEAGEAVEGFSDGVPRGRVAASEPDSGTEVRRGSAVTLILSRGPETVEVPAVVGMPEADAVAQLRELGFQVEVSRVYSEEAAAGSVCAADPAPGARAPNGSAVTLSISEGSAFVACPNCGGSGRVTRPAACGRCGGTGTVTAYETCPECGGSGLCPT